MPTISLKTIIDVAVFALLYILEKKWLTQRSDVGFMKMLMRRFSNDVLPIAERRKKL